MDATLAWSRVSHVGAGGSVETVRVSVVGPEAADGSCCLVVDRLAPPEALAAPGGGVAPWTTSRVALPLERVASAVVSPSGRCVLVVGRDRAIAGRDCVVCVTLPRSVRELPGYAAVARARGA
jgi:hypothetical protein